MDREINILSYLPEFIKEFREFQRLAEAENPELLFVWENLENVLKDQFVTTSTENGVKRWENILKIIPKGSETLDERKFRLLTRLNEKLPFTHKILDRQLASLCGEEGYILEVLNEEFTVVVKVELIAKSNLEDIRRLLERILPANMIFELSLLYNTHLRLNRFTNARLSEYTYEQLRSEVLK